VNLLSSGIIGNDLVIGAVWVSDWTTEAAESINILLMFIGSTMLQFYTTPPPFCQTAISCGLFPFMNLKSESFSEKEEIYPVPIKEAQMVQTSQNKADSRVSTAGIITKRDTKHKAWCLFLVKCR